MNAWSNELNLEDYADENSLPIHYYTRQMRGYKVHLFIVFWENQEQLLKFWEEVDSYVALNIQSQIELMIERSNFYVCHFVEAKVSIEIKREIEQNPFCAKKYVFDNACFNLQMACEYIEKKIFCLNLPSRTDSSSENRYIQKIQLKNFRGYKGCIEFSLLDRNNSPAMFTLVYAPNGVGKTSLFDGVEYALKGVVSYLKEIEKTSKFKGPIYHNKDRFDQIAYSRILLDDDTEILRSVGSVKENGTDTNIVPAKKGKEITGTATDRTKWDCIVLPHAKIDSFISAKKPEEKYKEWFESAPELTSEREKFEKLYKEMKALDSSIDKIAQELAVLQKTQETLKEQRHGFETVQKLVLSVNTISEIPILELSSLATELDYDELLNSVRKAERHYEKQLETVKRELLQLNNFKSIGLDKCKERLLKVAELDNQIEQITIDIKDRKKLTELEQLLSNINEVYSKIMIELEPYESVLIIGKEELLVCSAQFKSTGEIIETAEKQLSILDFEADKLRSEIISKEHRNQRIGILFAKQDDITKHVIELEKISLSIQIIQKEITVSKDCVNVIDDEILKLKKTIDKLQRKLLPATISEWDAPTIVDWDFVLNPELVKEIDGLRINYLQTESQIIVARDNATKLAQLLLSIKECGLRYQELHKENCVCPLCHHEFESGDFLWDRISKINHEGKGTDSVDQLIKTQSIIIERYSSIRDKLKKSVESVIDEQNRVLESTIDKRRKIQEKLTEYRQNYELQKKMERTLVDWLTENEIEFISTEYDLSEYYTLLQQESIANQEIITEKKKQMAAYEETKLNLSKKIKDCKEYQLNVINDVVRYPLVSFLIDLNGEFNDRHSDVIKRKEEALFNIECLKKQINEYSRVKNLRINQLEEALIEKKQVREKEVSFSQEFTPYQNYSEIELVGTINKYVGEQTKIETLLETFKQILEENSSRSYFSGYKKNKKTISEKIKRGEELTIQREMKQKVLDDTKLNLEKELSAYFSKSTMNDIYQKIDPHDVMKRLEYHLSFNDSQKGELYITLSEDEQEDGIISDYRPEIYFSSAQLNTVAFSSFFSRALDGQKDLPLQTIFIDDPIGHFDDMNVLGFADLMRSLIDNSKCQIVMSTHDEKVFQIMKRKLNDEYYSSCFLRLPNGNGVNWLEK